jgi:tetratricopeptide (TPR) repeat protein
MWPAPDGHVGPYRGDEMGQRRRELTPEHSPLHLWGSELRAWRDRRGLSLAMLGDLIRYDPSHVSRFERGERWPGEGIARACDDALKAEGALLRLWRLAEDRRSNPAIRERHVAGSAGHVASELPAMADGLPVQAASVENDGIIVPCRDLSGRIIWVSVPRRTFLLGGVSAAAGAVGGPVVPAARNKKTARALAGAGGPAADADPIEHLRSLRAVLVESDNLLGPRHIVSTVEEHIQLISQLRVARSGADRRALLDMQARYAEFAGWLHQDLGNFARAGHWLDRALEWAHAVGDPEMATYILARKSQLAGDMLDGAGTVDLAAAAQNMARPRSKLAAVAPTYAAHGHALLGEDSETLRALDHADDRLGNLEDDPASQWASWLDTAYITVHRAQCLEILGEHGQAADAFQQALRGLHPTYRRDRGVYLAREALAHAHAADPAQAAAAGMHALAIAAETGSGRIVNELARLDTELAAWRAVPDVEDFRTALTEIIPSQTGSGGLS